MSQSQWGFDGCRSFRHIKLEKHAKSEEHSLAVNWKKSFPSDAAIMQMPESGSVQDLFTKKSREMFLTMCAKFQTIYTLVKHSVRSDVAFGLSIYCAFDSDFFGFSSQTVASSHSIR